MKQMRLLLILVLLAVGPFSCQRAGKPTFATVEQVKTQFRNDVMTFQAATTRLKKAIDGADATTQQTAFRQARLAWKKVEWLTEYYFPATAKAINGAPIPEYEESDAKTMEPEGFQVIEPLLFPAVQAEAHDELVQQSAVLASNVQRLLKVAENNPTTDAHIFDALRLEVFRIITLGITGFDSPVAQYSLPETRAAIQSIDRYVAFYKDDLRRKDAALSDSLRLLFNEAYKKLPQTGNSATFNGFDRMAFITAVANPLGYRLLDAQLALEIEPFEESRGLRADARTLFDADAFNADHYAPGNEYRSSAERIALGKRLFFDPVLSGDGKRSCASCHQPQRAFTDALPRNRTLDGRQPILRNTPTLWNVGLQRALFADSRVTFLEDQATDVVTSVTEMHGSFENVVKKLAQLPEYRQPFAKAYGDGITSLNVRNAIASYERSLISLNSRFDRYVRGEQGSLNREEIQGFNLFAGKAKCATCHFLPLTNGLVPPHFEKSESESLGVPQHLAWRAARLDADPGKFTHTGGVIHRHLFKTPTVRNVALTAPYMHNGTFRTLEEVIDFYDKGGGKGIGIDLPNQTLSTDPLHLTRAEKAALVTFMEALTDTPTP